MIELADAGSQSRFGNGDDLIGHEPAFSEQAAKGGCKVAETAMRSRAQRVRCALSLERAQPVVFTGVHQMGCTGIRTDGASVLSDVRGQAVMESISVYQSAWMITTGRGLV